ncbi:transposable element gene [Prunus dulcis]|uniref:Transposable element protein n=2 Tax=Prunus dulcis TaxID=3755 RepID=A0A4Y1RMC8_PRUDU|nr:transposable element gene [Prunus dulcis]
MTGRPEDSDRSRDPDLDTLCLKTTGRPDGCDRSLGSIDAIPCVSCEDEFDTIPPFALPLPQSNRDTKSSELISDDLCMSTYQLPPRTTRGKPKVQYSPIYMPNRNIANSHYVTTHCLSKSYALYLCQLSNVCVPTKQQDALSNPKWTDAMNVKMDALNKNKTWDLVPLPQGKKAVGCKWVFTLKHKADGSIDRYKARLVAKGYTQTYGVDYLETFAPVAKLNTVRVLLSLAANHDWPLLQFDVKNVFLYGDLQEEIYMDLPPGIHVTSKKGVVCRLRKSLYGLKQSPRVWFGRFATSVKKFGYVQSNSDHTLFLKRRKDKLIALIIYVDDMIVTGDDQTEIQSLHKYMASEFEMKSLGDLKYFLGIEVARSKHGIFLSQRKYILDLLAETGMLDCKPIDTLSEQNHNLGLYPNQIPIDKERYQWLVGKLNYLAHTHPDITYVVSVVSQFMHSLSEDHMGVVTRILRYLKVTPSKGLMFFKYGHTDVEGYTVADWAGSATDRRSTSGYFTFVGGNLVTWRSKKQKVVSRSSAEAEYHGMAHGVCELLWLRRLLRDLGFGPKKPIDLHCDNKAAIAIAHNPVQHDHTKHVKVDRNFIKEKLDAKIVSFPFISSEY